jgi:anti-sigma B factor antagonist
MGCRQRPLDVTESPQLTITVHRAAARVVITLAGELDIAVEDEVGNLVAAAVADPGLTSLHVDVTGITYTGSSGLTTLLSARQTALDHGLDFTLGACDGAPVTRLIALFGLDVVLDIGPNTAANTG